MINDAPRGPVRFVDLAVTVDDTGTTVIASAPYPLVTVVVAQRGTTWVVRTSQHWGTYAIHGNQDRQRALDHARAYVVAQARHVWRHRLTGAQRAAVGRQRCPYLHCQGGAASGTIWCDDHPHGRKRR